MSTHDIVISAVVVLGVVAFLGLFFGSILIGYLAGGAGGGSGGSGSNG